MSDAVSTRLTIVTAVYNDWPACARLLAELDRVAAHLDCRIAVVVVDDGSTVGDGHEILSAGSLTAIDRVELLELVSNLGNQRALAVGLSVVAQRLDHDAVLVMDADGEDRPQDLPALLACFKETPEAVVVAARRERSEGWIFRIFYELYKILFRVLTGQRIAFGNFCLVPASIMRRLVYMPEVWNNLAATIRRSRFAIRSHDTARGQRYAGESSVNLTALIIHGLSAVSVYSDIAFVRVLMFALLLAVCTMGGILATLGIWAWTDLPIPGWTTTVVGSLSIILLQALLLSGGAVFLLLSQRSTATVVPALVAPSFVRRCTTVRGDPVPGSPAA